MKRSGPVDKTVEEITEVFEDADSIIRERDKPEDPEEEDEPEESLSNYLPVSKRKTTITKHNHFSLGYSELHEQADWVAYELTRLNIIKDNVDRTNNFREDPKVESESASLKDYRGSGYDRGHLCPASDMNFDLTAMSETFYMSNISPQLAGFNRGIWKELEMCVRDWSYANQHLYVVTGPVLPKRCRTKIGPNGVCVPKYYYKVLFDYRLPEQKMIGFVIPNEKSDKPLDEYMTDVDEVEALTGIDFFPELDHRLERKLEANFNPSRWLFDEERFQMRVGTWNKNINSYRESY